jgi:hypothetical protein
LGSNILFKGTASYQDWLEFHRHIDKRNIEFASDFHASFIALALENSKERLSRPYIGPYGTKFDYSKKKNNQSFIEDMQIQAALLYKYRQSHPRKLKGITLSEDVARDLQHIFSYFIAGYKLKPFFNPGGRQQENFYSKYIHSGMKKLKTPMMESFDRVDNLHKLLLYMELNGHVASSDFSVEEFTGNYTIKRLSDALKKKKLLNKNCDTIEDLNQLLKRADLYVKIIAAKKPSPSERLTKLKETYEKIKSSKYLRNLNRIAVEEFYPQETPKSQFQESQELFNLLQSLAFDFPAPDGTTDQS